MGKRYLDMVERVGSLPTFPTNETHANVAQWRQHRFCKAEHKHRGFESLHWLSKISKMPL